MKTQWWVFAANERKKKNHFAAARTHTRCAHYRFGAPLPFVQRRMASSSSSSPLRYSITRRDPADLLPHMRASSFAWALRCDLKSAVVTISDDAKSQTCLTFSYSDGSVTRPRYLWLAQLDRANLAASLAKLRVCSAATWCALVGRALFGDEEGREIVRREQEDRDRRDRKSRRRGRAQRPG